MALTLVLGAAGPTGTARGAGPQCPWMNTALSPAAARKRAGGGDEHRPEARHALPGPADLGSTTGRPGTSPAQPSLCIPDLVLNDAGQGVGDQETGTTAFPAPIAQSSSWDPALQYQFGQALGWEAWHKGINVQLAPGMEIDRVPLNGRNYEYMSEDPYLAGQGGVGRDPGDPVQSGDRHGQALRGQQPGDQPDDRLLGRRRAHAAGDLPAAPTRPPSSRGRSAR